MADASFPSRLERFARVASTNDIVRAWLEEGTPEVCIAVADEQTAGRGRNGRTWIALPGAALLCSIGFRPTWLAPDRAWQLAAIAALAVADAAEEIAGLRDRTIRLKWPNDLVVESAAENGSADVRKLAGLLGETEGLGTDDARVVVGVGLNADWPASDFPPELAPAMTSLREASGGRPIDRELLLEAFVTRLEARTLALRTGRFDVADWVDRQLTTGRLVRLEIAGGRTALVRALGVDATSGGLVVADAAMATGERIVLSGEVAHVRPADSRAVGV